MNSALAAASLSFSDPLVLAIVPFPFPEGTTSPLGLAGEMDRRLRGGGDGERSRGTGVIDLYGSDMELGASDYDLPFPFGWPIWTWTSRRGTTRRWRPGNGGRSWHLDSPLRCGR